MHFLIWSGTFLVVSVGASAVELAGMIGMPISQETQIAIAAALLILIGLGTVMAVVAQRASAPIKQTAA